MNIIILTTKREVNYVARMQGLFGTNIVKVVTEPFQSVGHLRAYCNTKGISAVFTTQIPLLRLLAVDNKASLDAYAGSTFHIQRNTSASALSDLDTIPVVILKDLSMLVKVPYQRFITQRHIKKITSPNSYLTANKFSYKTITAANVPDLLKEFDNSEFVAVDIETRKDLTISCCGYATVKVIGNAVVINSYVLPIDSLESVRAMRTLNAHKCRKALQNGKYDSAYFYIYSAPLTNYIFDTANMHHCWYSELPKDLATLAAFYVKDFRYWKHTSGDNLYEYNARDVYVTALVCLQWLKEAPAWAKKNYTLEFPVVFPSHLAEMTGMALDKSRMLEIKEAKEAEIKKLNQRLDTMLGVTNFNTNSPKQVKALMQLLGDSNATSGAEYPLKVLAEKHPLNTLVIDIVLKIRGLRKSVSTYLKDTTALADPHLLKNGNKPRILYSLNPHGTDTGRLASKEHHFWVGLNIQNIPRADRIKEIAKADDGFAFGEADYAQAESRDTGYIIGEENLIKAVESDKDFHKSNASMFFGVPYDEVTKPLRQLSKPVNHGANYNMGESMLIVQMGGANEVLKAGKLLGLPSTWTAKNIASHLLTAFDKAYPKIRHDYHDWVKYQVMSTKKLVGALGWTRYCFGNPVKNKLDLNAYVAHNPQSLNAMMLNKAVLKVFYNVWLKHSQDFLFLAQIHDSILFQYRIGKEFLIEKVQQNMTFPVEVTDITGVTRTLVVPTDAKSGSARWSGTAD